MDLLVLATIGEYTFLMRDRRQEQKMAGIHKIEIKYFIYFENVPFPISKMSKNVSARTLLIQKMCQPEKVFLQK